VLAGDWLILLNSIIWWRIFLTHSLPIIAQLTNLGHDTSPHM